MSFKQKIKEHYADKKREEDEILFQRLSPTRQAQVLFAKGQHAEAHELFLRVLEELNANSNIELFLELLRYSKDLPFDERQQLFAKIDESAFIAICNQDPQLIDQYGEEIAALDVDRIVKSVIKYLNHFQVFYGQMLLYDHFLNTSGSKFIAEAVNSQAFFVLSNLMRYETPRRITLSYITQKQVLIALMSQLAPSHLFWDAIRRNVDEFTLAVSDEVLHEIIIMGIEQGNISMLRTLCSFSSHYARIIIETLLSLSDELLSKFIRQPIIPLIFDFQEQHSQEEVTPLEQLKKKLHSIIKLNPDIEEIRLLSGLLQKQDVLDLN